MKKLKNNLMVVLITFGTFWSVLTLFAEMAGSAHSTTFGNPGAGRNALIVYNPDPFYNLDQQVCESFAQGLGSNGWYIQVMSVGSAKKTGATNFDLYVFCANTYNWSPDWAITRFINKQRAAIKGKKVVAITLGAGSTGRSQRVLEEIIKENGATLIGSRTYWLWRPNDRSRLKESNVKVAVEMAEKFGKEMSGVKQQLNRNPQSSGGSGSFIPTIPLAVVDACKEIGQPVWATKK